MSQPKSYDDVYWAVATLTPGGKILGLCEGFPPGEVKENEILLTKPEFNLLRQLAPHYVDIGNVKRLARQIEAKIIKTIKDSV